MFKSAIATMVTPLVQQVPLRRVLIIPFVLQTRFMAPILLNPGLLSDLPGGILEELERAVVCIDVAAMNEAIAQIALHPPAQNAAIAEALKKWVDEFDYPSILSFIRQSQL